jgi:hypothetical protein
MIFQPVDLEHLAVLARMTADQLGQARGSSTAFVPFLLGIVFTLLAGFGAFLLHKQQQLRYQKEKIIAAVQDVDLDTLKQLLGGVRFLHSLLASSV